MTEKKTILLIEDNPDDELLAMRAFKKSHIANRVVVARDGEEALEILFGDQNGSHKLPQLVLLDLKLPKLGGMEVLRHIRENERTRYLPVVVLTTSTEQQDLVESYALGCNSYIQKPVDFKQFSDAVARLGVYWLLMNETPRS